MPEQGIDFVHRSKLLTFEEMERLVRILATSGVTKVRITGGEPFVRKGLLQFLEKLAAIDDLREITLTTNGTLTKPFIPFFRDLRISSVNLSLDTLDRQRFLDITRRDELPNVLKTFDRLMEFGIETKINCVVMQGRNEGDILPLAELTEKYPVDVRFIEEMPFNGDGHHPADWSWDQWRIVEFLKTKYPTLEKLPDPPFSTAYQYAVNGHKGKLGIIAAYSRSFCGTCNRIRLTPQGVLKTCLYDSGVINIRDLLRAGASDSELQAAFADAVAHRYKNGFEAEQNRFQGLGVSESMATIGG